LRIASSMMKGSLWNHDLGAGDAAGEVDARDHVERHAGIAGRAHHIERARTGQATISLPR
jgi:hypothetical protein